MHVILDNPAGAITLQNPALLESLRQLGDAHNVLGSFPTLTDKAQRELYTPLWDLRLGVWSDAVVASGENFAQDRRQHHRAAGRPGLHYQPRAA